MEVQQKLTMYKLVMTSLTPSTETALHWKDEKLHQMKTSGLCGRRLWQSTNSTWNKHKCCISISVSTFVLHHVRIDCCSFDVIVSVRSALTQWINGTSLKNRLNSTNLHKSDHSFDDFLKFVGKMSTIFRWKPVTCCVYQFCPTF